MSKPRSLKRREFLAATAGAPLALVLGARRQTQPQPNIVFIVADDLGYADVSCYGRRDYVTPNIDTIASGGMCFTQAYANSAVCSATRTGLITGRYQYRLPVGLEEPLGEARKLGLPPAHPTLPSLLRNAGYATMLIGKWHLGWPPEFGPLKSGYDHFWGLRSGGVDYFTHKTGIASTDTHDLWDDDVEIHRSGYITDLLGDRTVSAIQDYAAARRPFFISLHFTAPHWPWEGPGDEMESLRIQVMRDHDGGSLATFTRMVLQMDLQVGRVLQALETASIANNTIVIFTSDNGGERFSDNWPFTGMKNELLEGGLRIPSIIRWPGHVPAGTKTDQVAISMDWLPTLLAAAGARPDAAYPSDGINLLPALTQNAPPLRRTLFWRYKNKSQRAVRDGDMKWLKIGDNTFLFNVVDDQRERANLKERQPETFRKLAAMYDQWSATMLPEDPASSTSGFFADQLADHYGNERR